MPFKAGKTKAIDVSSLAKLGQSTVDLAKYTEDEFAQVAVALQADDPFTVNYVAPSKPRQGMLAYADGTHWNPGNGEGFYEYTSGGVWVPTFINSSSGVISIAGAKGAFTLNTASGIKLVTQDIQLSQGSASQFGAVKVDGTTITASGGIISAVNPSSIKASLGADVNLTTITTYFDGPSIAQGTVGTWFVIGTVTCIDTTGAANFICKLWDGTTVVSSSKTTSGGTNFVSSITLAGVITNPAGNLKISVKDINTATGKILANATGEGKDSSITAFRIA